MVIMASTGSGKSLLFQVLPFIIKNAIVLVIMPILSLIEDQCQWMKKYGILVVALIADIIATDPTIWKKVEAGDYAVILGLLEVLLRMPPSFSFVIYEIYLVYSISA